MRKCCGNVSKVIKVDEDEKDIEKYEFDLRVCIGGVLKFFKEFFYVVEDLFKDEKLRGIIKLFEGFYINSYNVSEEEGFIFDIFFWKRILSMNDGSSRSSGFYGFVYIEKLVFLNKEVWFSIVNEKIIVFLKKYSISIG